MDIKEPTKEEEQWFWEQCGFKKLNYNAMGNVGWKWSGYNDTDWVNLELDLNNLKLYAFPLMDRVSIYIDNEYLGKKKNKVRVMYKNSFYDGENERLEDAVVEAISKAFGGK